MIDKETMLVWPFGGTKSAKSKLFGVLAAEFEWVVAKDKALEDPIACNSRRIAMQVTGLFSDFILITTHLYLFSLPILHPKKEINFPEQSGHCPL